MGNPTKKRKASNDIGAEGGHTTHMAGKRIYNKKNVKQRSAKKVKVSPKLKKAIKQVTQGQLINGSLTNHYLGGSISAINRQQTVQNSDGSTANSAATWMFDLTQFADAAAQLFKKKAGANVPSAMNPFSSGSFDPATLQVKVKNSYSILRYKNVTPHCIVLKLFVCAPKKKSCSVTNDNPSTGYGKFNVTQTVKDSLATPYQYWVNGLSVDVTNGFVLPGNWNGATTADVKDFYREPTQCKSFNMGYKVEKIQFHIEPGQTVVHRVQGPKNMMLDFGKMWSQDVFENVQKFSRHAFVVMYNTLNASVNASEAKFGRYADVVDTPAKGYAVIVERTDHFSLGMPEQTGLTLPATYTSGVTDLELRRPRSKVNIYDQTVTTSPVGTLDLSKENPVQNVSG